MARHKAIPAIAAVVVGVLTSIQARINGGLAVVLHDGFQAAVVSFTTGLIILTVMVAVSPQFRDGLRRVRPALKRGDIKWWQLGAGVLGGFYVAVQCISVPVVGVALFTVAIVAAQSGASVVVDKVGLGPAGRQPVTVTRVAAAVIAVLAVAIAVSDRFGSASFSLPVMVLAMCAGVGIAIQQALNGRVGVVTRQPISAAWLNFVNGLWFLLLAFFIAWMLTPIDPSPLPTNQWWLYLGGTIGLIFIATAAWVVQRIGVLQFALMSIAGQLLGALFLDVFSPTEGTILGWRLFIGVGLAFVAVMVSARRRVNVR